MPWDWDVSLPLPSALEVRFESGTYVPTTCITDLWQEVGRSSCFHLQMEESAMCLSTVRIVPLGFTSMHLGHVADGKCAKG